ncbi:P-loop containing nucleoside triphosphate hydrolase protein [Trametes elegans]|nr:P-loop containing nucleoside triphosphate hydrolase protein [Trametes elegans]
MPSLTLNTRNLVPGCPDEVAVKRISSSQCDALKALLDLDNSAGSKAVGVSLRLSHKGSVQAVAFATETLIVHVTVDSSLSEAGARAASNSCGLARVLGLPGCVLAAVNMARVGLLLHRQLGVHSCGVDLPELLRDKDGLPPPGKMARDVLHPGARTFAISKLWYYDTNNDLGLRAWLSACIAAVRHEDVQRAPKLRTTSMPAQHLACISLQVMNVALLEAKKPTHFDNDFERLQQDESGKLKLHNARFNTRVRHSNKIYISINGGEGHATTQRHRGKTTTLKLRSGKLPQEVKSVRVMGRGDPTCAELCRDIFVGQLLCGNMSLTRSSFIRLLWFPKGKQRREAEISPAEEPQFADLNPSQRRVSAAMISDNKPLVIAHGPPGTGKTTTIAAALVYWQEHNQPTWVIAQSNVGVKNIARSIIKKGVDFKLIVSLDFHFEWHEHLYKGDVEGNLICSDEFSQPAFDPKRWIGNSKIILCTLAMLSNPGMEDIFKCRPVNHLVVDEASQIDTFEFMHLFDKFEKTLKKVCMFGDPKQLPPYGKETAPNMKTIFDFTHLTSSAYFLDTQYRMPVPLGAFISKEVYASRLKSEHKEKSNACVRAIDVRKGEEKAAGSSWENHEEAHTVVNLVRHYYSRLGDDKFCIITPYDAQRALMTAMLKSANLPSDIVYNVDSYQGTYTAPSHASSCARTHLICRPRGAVRDCVGGADDEAGIPELPEPDERHAHAMPGRNGPRHPARVRPRRWEGHPPRKARPPLGGGANGPGRAGIGLGGRDGGCGCQRGPAWGTW